MSKVEQSCFDLITRLHFKSNEDMYEEYYSFEHGEDSRRYKQIV